MNEIMTIQGIECYEVEGTAYLKLETVARGLGFTKTETKNGAEYTTIRWERVFSFLDEIGFDHKWAKDIYIPENIFYRLAMKAKNETAEAFQALIADEIIPAIRKHGAYIAPQAQTAPANLDAAALQAVTAAMDTLSTMVQTLAQRLDAMERRPQLPAAPTKPLNNKLRRQWMRMASERLSQLADECGLPSTTVLHDIYHEMESELSISLSEVRLKAIEEHQLSDCSFLLAIFYDDALRKWFVERMETHLTEANPFW